MGIIKSLLKVFDKYIDYDSVKTKQFIIPRFRD